MVYTPVHILGYLKHLAILPHHRTKVKAFITIFKGNIFGLKSVVTMI